MALIDDFNRAAIGANWTANALNDGGVNLATSGSTKGTAGAATYAMAYYNVGTVAADCRVGVTLSAGAGSTRNLQLAIRLATPATAGVDGYLVDVNPTTIDYYRYDNGSATKLGATETVSIANTDQISFGAIGSTLQVFKNGLPLGASRTDATYSAAGYAALGGFDNGWLYDDFSVTSVDPNADSASAVSMFSRRRRRIV